MNCFSADILLFVIISFLVVTTDEENDDTVRVCLVFPGLKKKLCFAEAANADISIDIKEQ